MSFQWFYSALSKIWPEDKTGRAGVWPFVLPEDHPFNQVLKRAVELHDTEYDLHHQNESTSRESEVDWALFWRLVLIASKEEDSIKRCYLAGEICKYWPYARAGGRLAWKLHNKGEDANADI